MNDEINSIKKQLKGNIQKLIDSGSLKDAKELIEQYKNIAEDDIEVYSMYAVVLIMEGQLGEAEEILREGLNIDKENFDLNYNLGYVYEQKKDFNNAIKNYEIALNNCKDKNTVNSINEVIKIIQSEHNIKLPVAKKKIVFFDKGDDKFIWDIIKGLSDEYETKHITVHSFKQIDEGMAWADICWFEWCDELIIYGSKLPLAREKKIICRLHRYEAFTNYIQNVNWINVDKLIIVTPHLLKFLKAQISDINKKVDVVTISNGVNLNKYKFKKRKRGFNIAYIGYIHSRKNPVLLLQIINLLVKKDTRYKLYVAGKFQDPLIELYWNDQINKMNLKKNVIFQGWQKNIGEWLENKNYVLSTSIHESFGYGIAEAMARGIKPVIHNFLFAEEIWDKKFMFNSIDEAVVMISENNYNSKDYRGFIEDNYSLDKQLKEIRQIVGPLLKEKNNKGNNIIEFQNNNIDIKFYLPFLNDWIQKIVYSTKNFYEISMLEDIKKRIGENKSIVDIGANIGNHTIYFSKICKAKNVYSFEPQRNIFNILKKNVQINNVNHIVKLFNMGLGKNYSHADVIVTDKNNYGSSKLNENMKGEIEINLLDNVLINQVNNIDMIKIDVEGMELEVLEGATKILKKFNPLIYIEAGTDEEFNVVSYFLSKYKYKPIYRFNATPTYLFMPINQLNYHQGL